MARRPLPVGEHGSIVRTQVAPGKWTASARVRDADGKTRQVRGFGASGAAAERALKAQLKDRSIPGDADITGESKVAELAQAWLAESTAEGRLSLQSLEKDQGLVKNHVLPGLGNLRLREVTPKRLDGLLRELATVHPRQAQRVKGTLSSMFTLAVRRGAVPTNPVRDLGPLRRPEKKPVKAMTIDELQSMRAAVQTWRTVSDENGHKPVGPRPTRDLQDIVDGLAGSGLRVGELLATLWVDIDLTADVPTLTVTGTLSSARGIGLYRKPKPKTDAGRRTLFLPPFLAEILRRRLAENPPNDLGAVFVTRKGTFMSPNNVRRQLRAVRAGTPLEFVTPHTFRKTVATTINAEVTLLAAAQQLGHKEGTPVTQESYIVAKPNVAPDVTGTLELLAPLTAYSPLWSISDGQ